jgi:hypothetical protein
MAVKITVQTFVYVSVYIYTRGSSQAVLDIQVPVALFPGLKRPGREYYHSSPSNAEVKNEWSYTCTPPYSRMTRAGTTLIIN